MLVPVSNLIHTMSQILRFILCLAIVVSVLPAQAQVTRDFAIDLKADVSPAVPHITLSWSLRQNANITAQSMYRRLKGAVNWGSPIATLSTTDTTWADTTAMPGVEYEYWMSRSYTSISPNTALGYITAGYNLPMVENRGVTLLVVDDTMAVPLAHEIEQLKRDLAADGWRVQVISASRRDSLTDVTAVADTKELIKAAYDADPTNVKQVYIIGHVPVPYAGSQAPDGHGNHSGAWSADNFYGDMNGTWTDSTITNTSSTEARIHNIPGDGKLDQSNIPSPLELAVGRVDLRNMQRAPATNVTETTLLRRYLKKAHDFKTKQGAYAAVQRRVLIRDGFGAFGSESFMRTGWAWGFTGVGRPPEVTFDEAPSGNWWTHAATNTYLMANGNGGGSYETCGSVGATADFGRRPFKAAFVSLFGSYFGDWDVTNNFMKAPLAGNATGDGLGLTCFWAGRPTFFMHHMATGETVGYSIRLSMNSQNGTISSPIYTPINFPGGGTHLGLMGDPSLRMHVVEPPRHLAGTSTSGSVNLSWAASAESSLLGYHVYRAATADGPFTRLTTSPLVSPAYADATGTAGNAYTYMVRTLKMESSPGGTYENLSLGEMVTLTVNASATGAPANPSGLAVVQNSGVSASLTWQDNASDETGFRVERKASPTGSWSTLATVAANATGHTDPGLFTSNEIYYYRVVALNGVGDSPASNEASFEAIPGFFEFDDTVAKVSKAAGTVTIPVKRFGGVNGAVSVNFASSNSSATAGTHYTASSGTLNWADGETGVKNISVPITNTAGPQVPRQFRLTLSTPSAGTGIGTYNAIAVLIEDPAATLASPWVRSSIGAVTDWSASTSAEGALSLTSIGGSGLSSAATSEVGNFLAQPRTGDGVMTAFISAATPAQSGARFAVMVRSDASGGGNVMAGTFAGNSTTGSAARMISRATSGGTAAIGAATGGIALPCWLRITRAGNTFQSEASTDGSTWVSQGTVSIATMPATAQWGLFHTCDDRNGTTYSANFQTAMFTNVAFTAVTVPGAVATLTATSSSPTAATLTWTAATSAGGYRVERRTESGSFAQIIDLPGGTLNFTDSGLAPNSGYEYRVYAYNASGAGPLSNTARATTTAPESVVSITTSTGTGADAMIKGGDTEANFGTANTARVGGNTNTGAITSTSKLYLKFDLASVSTLGTPASSRLRLSVAGSGNFEQAGYTFTSTVRALPDTQEGWNEGTVTWTNAPLNNTATNGFLAGTVTMGASFSITDPLSIPGPGATLSRNISPFNLLSTLGTNNTVCLILNTASTGVWLDFASKEHASLNPPTLELTYASALPKRPSFLTVIEGTGAALDLAWADNTSTETGFEIERRPAGGGFSVLTTTAADAAAYSDAATTLGQVYEYRVRAISASGNSAWTPVVAATAGGSTGPLPGERLTFATWMEGAGLTSESSTDSDGDGVANLLEYALGAPANYAANSGAPVVGERQIGNDKFLTLTFARRMDVTDVTLQVEVSESLIGPWTALDPLQPENQAEVLSNTPDAGWQTITVKDKEPMNGSSRRFMRLVATPK